MRSFECYIKPLAGESTTPRIFLPPEDQGLISGIVLEPGGQPVQGALVLLLEQESGQRIAHTVISDQGRFWFGPLEPGVLYALRIQKDDSAERVVEFSP